MSELRSNEKSGAQNKLHTGAHKPDHPLAHHSHVPRKKLTLGQKMADRIAYFGGSWIFIGLFFTFLIVWIAINLYFIVNPIDPYPFILLNLVLSCLAAIQAPIILMAQNRSAERDRSKAERDYYINRKAEREIANMQTDLDDIKVIIKNIHSNTTGLKKKL